MADNTVKGDTAKMFPEVIEFLDLVAKNGKKDITIKKGGGFRTQAQEAEIVYRNWTGSLKRGAVFDSGSLSGANREQLDKYYATAEESKDAEPAKQKEAKAEFLKLALKIPSYHKLGKAVDLIDNMTPAMRKVLEKHMKFVDEPGCYHLQWKGSLPDEETIKKEMGIKEEKEEEK
jgi:hypothetical protein